MINNKTTFCNPIVLPDYPLLNAKKQDMGPFGHDRHFVTEMQILKEKYPDKAHLGFEPPEGGDLPPMMLFGRETENDVRATADPTVMYYEGKWYLYCTSGVIYHSEDFHTWIPHGGDEVWKAISAPMAPTVEHFRGRFYATSNSTPLYVAENPLGPWKLIGQWVLPDGRDMLANDPMIFADDDDRIYLYWGLGSGIFGAELDPKMPNHLITEPKLLITFNPEHWWERFGAANEDWSTGCTEGSWMYKRDGTYYLLYSTCGTEYTSYAMGAYICKSPLGDFKPQPKNPVSRTYSGLIRGGGHGSIVNGPNNTIWCFYTIPVSIDHIFERRIGMDPVGISEDGSIYALTGCNVPQYVPGILSDPEKGNDAGLVPLTICKPTRASSYAPGHYPLHGIDESLNTYWQPADGDKTPAFTVSLNGSYYISAIRLMWKDVGLDYEKGVYPGPYRFVIESCEKLNGENWITLVDESKNNADLSVDFRTFDTVPSTKVRIRILSAPEGVRPGILNFTVFGVSTVKQAAK